MVNITRSAFNVEQDFCQEIWTLLAPIVPEGLELKKDREDPHSYWRRDIREKEKWYQYKWALASVSLFTKDKRVSVNIWPDGQQFFATLIKIVEAFEKQLKQKYPSWRVTVTKLY